MIRIAICDDEKAAAAEHETITRQCLKSIGISYKITVYSRSDNLLYDIQNDSICFDLLLLDIEMPEYTGMDIAAMLRPAAPDLKIIFITSHLEYTIDAFELAIFRYVPKNDLEPRLTAAVRDAAKLIELEAGRDYIIRTNSRVEKLPLKDILYIKRDGKNAGIVSLTGISRVRKSLQHIYDELDSREFIYIDRGYIVNIIHIMKICDGMAYLKNGEQLAISRSHLAAVKQQINQFWGTHI